MAEGDAVEFRAIYKEQKRVKPGHEIELVFAIPNTSKNRKLLAGTNMSAGATIFCVEGDDPDPDQNQDPNQMALGEEGGD